MNQDVEFPGVDGDIPPVDKSLPSISIVNGTLSLAAHEDA